MAVKAIARVVDLLLVVGSENSSDLERLVEVGTNFGVRSYLVNDRGDVDRAWLNAVTNVGVTAGASAPEHLVEELIAFLRNDGFHQVEEIEMVDEDVRFSLPSDGWSVFDEHTACNAQVDLDLRLEEAMRRACANLADLQAGDGHWCAELTADTTLESDYILFQLWLNPPAQGRWDPPTRRLIDKAVWSIFEWQLDDGGFNINRLGDLARSARR